MMPAKLQHQPEGPWRQWVGGHVDPDILRMKSRHSGGNPTMVNGVVVFALKFDDGREWNVKEGWK